MKQFTKFLIIVKFLSAGQCYAYQSNEVLPGAEKESGEETDTEAVIEKSGRLFCSYLLNDSY